MKSFTTIDNLRAMFKEDFSKGYENQFVKLKEDIIRELQESSTKKLLIMQSRYTVSRLWRKEHRQK